MALTPQNSHDTVSGSVASGVTDSGNPVKIGLLADSGDSIVVASGQRVNARGTRTGAIGVAGSTYGFNAGSDAQNVHGFASYSAATSFAVPIPVAVAEYVLNGSTFDRVRTPFVFKNLSAVVITAETTIWTPAGGKKFRLMGFLLTQGVLTGAITLRDNTAGTTILTIPPNTIGVSFQSPPMGNGILSAAANNVLTAQGAVTETITGYVFGTEE